MTFRGAALRNLLWISVFGVAFSFVESSVVVYLRALYYPEGFAFPLKFIARAHLHFELVRELATVVMLGAVSILAGRSRWERFGFFLVAFGVWDVFFYVWLKVIVNWPSSLADWDILFLLPVPWIGPVIAPLLIALSMVWAGAFLVLRLERGGSFRPAALSWTCSIGATALLLFSFMSDYPAAFQQQAPAPYRYELLAAGLVLYGAALVVACKAPPAGEPSG